MAQQPTFAPSLMCMDLLNAADELAVLDERANAYHVDLMDGHYCPNITLSPDFVKAVSDISPVPLDVHMMVTKPTDWIETLVASGATWISPHAETINVNAFRVMNVIEELGAKPGLVINPSTPLVFVENYLERVDLVTFMTVDVGFAGQPFIEQVLPKIEQAVAFREREGLSFTIQIDGSCNRRTFRRLWDAGADRFIVGSSGLWSRDENLGKAWARMLTDFEEETGYTFV